MAQLKGFNFKKLEIIILSIIGLFVTKYINIDMIYRLNEHFATSNTSLTIHEKDLLIFKLLTFLVTLTILYQYTKWLINRKWVNKRKEIENFINDLNDIIIENIIK